MSGQLRREEREIQEFREVMQAPTTFKDGFGAKTIIGAVFLGLFMLPGSMYLTLFMGAGLGPAARWGTVILFSEVPRGAPHKQASNPFSNKIWLAPFLFLSFQLLISRVTGFGLGYALYRLTAH